MAQALVKSKIVVCPSCPFKISDEDEYLDHVKIHLHEFGYRIRCMLCPQKLKNFESYRKHKDTCPERNKIAKIAIEEELTRQKKYFWLCKICNLKETVSSPQNLKDFKKIQTHLLEHSYKYNDVVLCPSAEKACFKKEIDKYKTLSHHLNQHKTREEFELHSIESETLENDEFVLPEKNVLPEHIEVPEQGPELAVGIDSAQMPVDFPVGNRQNGTKTNVHELNSSIKHTETLFALKMTSQFLMSQDAINNVVSHSKNVHSMKIEFMPS